MLEKFLIWSAGCYKHPKILVTIAIVLTLIFGAFLPRLTFDNNLRNMLPKGSNDVAVNDYYEDESRFGSSNLILIGLETDNVFTEKTIRYIQGLETDLDALNQNMPAKSLAFKLGISADDAVKLVTAIATLGVNKNNFGETALPVLRDGAALQTRFGFSQPVAEKIARMAAGIEAGKFWSLYERPISKVQTLANSDYIASSADELVVEKLLPDGELTPAAIQGLKDRIASWDVYQGGLVSKDGTLTPIVLSLNNSDGDVMSLMDKELTSLLKPATANGFKTYLDGEPIISNRINSSMREDMVFLMPLVIFLVLGILWFCFRTWSGVIYPILVVLISVIWGLGIQTMLGVPLTVMSVAMPVLLVAIASAYGIHQMNHYLLDPSTDKATILANNMRSVGLAITLSGLTVMIGFGALIVEDFVPMRNFGIFTAIGDLVGVIAALYFLPAFILLSKKPKASLIRESDHGWIGQILKLFVNINRRGSLAVVITAIVLTLGFFGGTFLVKSEMNNVSLFKDGEPVREADNKLNEKLAGTQVLNIILDSDLSSVASRLAGGTPGETVDLANPTVLKAVDGFGQAVLQQFPFVTKVGSFNDILKKINKEMKGGNAVDYAIPDSADLISQYLLIFGGDTKSLLSANHDKLRITLTMKRTTNAEVEKVRNFAVSYFTPEMRAANHLQVQISGAAHLYYVTDHLLVEGTYRSIIACVIVVFLLLLYVLRSFWMSLIAMIPIAMTLAIDFGVLGFFGIPLNSGTAMVSSIAIGIGVDYSIHYITWYRNELRKNPDVIPSLEATIMHKGRAILYNMFVIIGGFIVLVFSRFIPLVQFGGMVSVCMLTTALGALIVVPAVMRLLAVKQAKFLFLGIKPPTSAANPAS